MSRHEHTDRFHASANRADKLRGVYLAVVTANTEDGGDSKYRCKVKFPWLGGSDDSFWARIVVPMAGAARGTYMLPEVEDQVLVVFEHGDVTKPLIIGGVWSEAQKPPETNADGKNNLRVIKSKTGHRLIFDDTDGAERVILVDSTGKNKVLLDSANKCVTVETADGDIEIKASA
ncbi:MAG TPA: phage baseplate assembly protein V, partial [Kofleriaceae bacterium]|nr:phage baseplate assembly protein V [Kofleriaceae bacterium]